MDFRAHLGGFFIICRGGALHRPFWGSVTLLAVIYFSSDISCDILRETFIGSITVAIGDTFAIIQAPGQAWSW